MDTLQLYEMDAHVGVEVLGIMYMKGDQPHCGFPEAAYRQYAEALARAGYKVVVVEQVHTMAWSGKCWYEIPDCS